MTQSKFREKDQLSGKTFGMAGDGWVGAAGLRGGTNGIRVVLGEVIDLLDTSTTMKCQEDFLSLTKVQLTTAGHGID